MILSRLPRSVLGISKEILRHLLRRPVVGIAAAARTEDGRWVLIRRADTGTWALPGGTLEWGETLRTSLARELHEEAGIESCTFVRLVGVFSHPDRDLRFHAVTIVAEVRVPEPTRPPMNELEIREVKLFRDDELPSELAMGMTEMLEAARRNDPAVLE